MRCPRVHRSRTHTLLGSCRPLHREVQAVPWLVHLREKAGGGDMHACIDRRCTAGQAPLKRGLLLTVLMVDRNEVRRLDTQYKKHSAKPTLLRGRDAQQIDASQSFGITGCIIDVDIDEMHCEETELQRRVRQLGTTEERVDYRQIGCHYVLQNERSRI